MNQPTPTPEAPSAHSLQMPRLRISDYTEHILGRLLVPTPPVRPETTAEEVFRLFEENAELRAVAVTQGDAVVGLISRFEMLDNMARPFRHELFGRKGCTVFMDREPLMADVRVDLRELSGLISNAPARHLVSGFIVTDDGRYLGMASVQGLMRELTEMQIQAARYANPLTQLPGNVPIQQTIDHLLQTRQPFVAAYCDLDHFKPLNDVFGYARGDAIIILTGRILQREVDAERDFVGHVGGDDFVLLLRSPDWQVRLERILQSMEAEIPQYFAHEAREQGGYEAANRKGEKEFYPLTSLSIGALVVAPEAFSSHLEVAAVVSEAKKRAKSMAGNSLFINQRQYGSHE